MDSVTATGIKVDKEKDCDEEREYDGQINSEGHRDECKQFRVITRLSFEDESGQYQKDIFVEWFSYKVMNIEKVCYKSGRIFLEEDGFFSSLLLRFGHVFCEKPIFRNEDILLIKPYYKNLKQDELRGIININILENTENLLPISTKYNYEVIGHKFVLKNLGIKRGC